MIALARHCRLSLYPAPLDYALHVCAGAQVMYNDISVLENFHLASAWRLMQKPHHDPFGTLSEAQYTEIRQTVIEAVLGTDLKHHFSHLTHFKTRRAAHAFDEPQRKDVRLLLACTLHAADVSNLAKPWPLSVQWVARLFMEQFLQGDREQRLGLPISALSDRHKVGAAC